MTFKDALLKIIDSKGGKVSLSQIYATVEQGQYFPLQPHHLKTTIWGDRPAYQHEVREILATLVKDGKLTRVSRGVYSITPTGTRQGPFDFSDIIPKLQSAGRGNRIRLPYDCNSIPWDVQGECRPRLVVWIEEDADNSQQIHEALRQVAETCRGITRAVLFIVDIDKAIWQDLWGSFEPGFAVEQKELELKIVIEFRP